jgi:hypothetical protein
VRLTERARIVKPVIIPGAFPPIKRPLGGPQPGTLLEFFLEAAIFLFRMVR